MERLHDCPDGIDSRSCGRKGTLIDPKTEHQLTLQHDDAFELRQLDLLDEPAGFWPPDRKRPDGVMVVRQEATDLVCFIELKGSVDLEDGVPVRPYAQLRQGAEHFAASNEHGGRHHEQWRAGEDLDVDGFTKTHLVVGVVLVQRGGTRARPLQCSLSGREVTFVTVQRSGRYAHVELSVDELLFESGLSVLRPTGSQARE